MGRWRDDEADGVFALGVLRDVCRPVSTSSWPTGNGGGRGLEGPASSSYGFVAADGELCSAPMVKYLADVGVAALRVRLGGCAPRTSRKQRREEENNESMRSKGESGNGGHRVGEMFQGVLSGRGNNNSRPSCAVLRAAGVLSLFVIPRGA